MANVLLLPREGHSTKVALAICSRGTHVLCLCNGTRGLREREKEREREIVRETERGERGQMRVIILTSDEKPLISI